MVCVARIIRHRLCIIYAFFDIFVQKSFMAKKYFLTAETHLTTRVPLYTCLVLLFLDIARQGSRIEMVGISSNLE